MNESKSKSSGDRKEKRGRKKLKVVELQPSTAWRWAKALNFAVFETNKEKIEGTNLGNYGEDGIKTKKSARILIPKFVILAFEITRQVDCIGGRRNTGRGRSRSRNPGELL